MGKKNKNKAKKQNVEFSNEISNIDSNENQQQNKKSKQDKNC